MDALLTKSKAGAKAGSDVKSQPREKISGSKALLQCLVAENVDVLFGYPGGAIMRCTMPCMILRTSLLIF